MNLKSILKLLKLNESTISMVLGALVIVVVGLLVVNYFRGLDQGETFPEGISTEEEITLPTTHIVKSGETLWSISEIYYHTGYNWVDIAEANDLSRADIISEGQSITIPDVNPRSLEATQVAEAQPTVTPEPTIEATSTPEPTEEPIITPEPTQTPAPQMEEQQQQPETGDTYTVVKGDTLWDIAAEVYGDPFRWVDIAQANHLVNPDLIHPGNVFVLPQ